MNTFSILFGALYLLALLGSCNGWIWGGHGVHRWPVALQAKAAVREGDGGSGAPRTSSKFKAKVSEEDDGGSAVVDVAFKAQMKELRKLNAPKKLVKAVKDLSDSGRLDQNMTAFAFRTLQYMNRSDLCSDLIPLWSLAVQQSLARGNQVELSSAAVLARSMCRLNRTDLAESVAEIAGAYSNDEVAKALLPELAVGHVLSDTDAGRERCLSLLFRLKNQHPNATVELEQSKRILKTFLREGRSVADVRLAVRLLLHLGGLTDNDSLQLLTSAFMKSLDFVKGAVSMQTLPDIPAGPPHCNEAAFIGRSNVGKSSLINMIANRKGLVFTSKTPGKTKEFNYFDANGTVGSGRQSEQHRFFLVDLPGVGYAEVSRDLRTSWLSLLGEYVTGRPNLRVLFHLVDSRHGLLDADFECLELLPALPLHVQYCVVLTKADKRGGGVHADAMERIQREIRKRTDRDVPVALSSADARLGGVQIWSVLLDSLAKDALAT